MAEILAPAGNLESVYAAVRCGADAVYLAGEAFNARRNAENFTFEQLQTAVAYCHAHSVKVYHALNTLVKDSETDALTAEIERILSLGEDALILQDLGIARIVKAMCPEMPLHASTQLSVHSLSGVKALEAMGFQRVVLAREMSREEIAYIRKNTTVELEIFVHGALCMCVSGQCYFSAFLGARSGNRGLCAQPCRLPIRAPGGSDHALSLKDNSLIEYLPALDALGIDSFKIEGRMKRPEYVAASVSACAAALEGAYTASMREDLKNIFSRQGFTDGYYTARRGKVMFGARTKADVTAADSRLLKDYAALYAKEKGRIPANLSLTIRENTLPRLTMAAEDKMIEITGDKPPEKALRRALSQAELTERLSKLGGTPYYPANVSVTLDDGLMLAAGDINALRRQGVEALTAARQKPPYHYQNTLPPLPPARNRTAKGLYLRFADMAQAANISIGFDKILLPIEQAAEAVERFGTQRLILETPRVFFGAENQLISLLEEAKALGVQEIAVGNIGALYLAKQKGFRVFACLGTNLFNSYACAETEADSILLSFELSTAQIAAIRSEKPCGNLLYGHIPLIITRNCPLSTGRSCQSCDRKGFLTDRKGEKLPVRCRFGASEIFNPRPLYMIDKEKEIDSDFSLLYFTTETPQEAAQILDLYTRRATAPFPFTRGLYAKGVK